MNESAFWTTHIEEAIGTRIAPRLRISLSSPKAKPSSKLFQISATQSSGGEGGADRLADDRPLDAGAGREERR